MALQKQGTAMYQLSSFRLIACELIMACLFMLCLLRSTHHHPSITLILPLPFLLFYAQSKSGEVVNMWGYPVL